MGAKFAESAKRLSIYINEKDRWQGKPLYHAIVLEAKEMGIAGASVYRCIEGFGENKKLKTARFIDLSVELPIVIEIIDHEDRLESFLPKLEQMVQGGILAIEDIKVIKYKNSSTKTK